ncbi:MAG: hypothetical protein HY587_06545 [Candidatus Omnitrophica bacterium]|nr:hypothetical protein [Candidatus Omnitrophota bacterium]
MILKWSVILICLALGYVCVKLLIREDRQLNTLEGTPMNVVDDLEQPRSQLLKTIAQLRGENEQLKKRVVELEKQQGRSATP